MKKYKTEISLRKNKRGCYILDTVKGCSGCSNDSPGGCYGDCYANKIAIRYGYDFSRPVKRNFDSRNDQLYMFGFSDKTHENKIINQIENINMPFVRIGDMGDPSDEWGHTIEVCEKISQAQKPIVIITKHWKTISSSELKRIGKLNICINTSISALDNPEEIEYRLYCYNLLNGYCKSILRIVSCEFDTMNEEGQNRNNIQVELFKNANVIDTIFRPSKYNHFVKDGIIKTTKTKFLNGVSVASVRNKNTYFGYCNKCPEMCGINI